MAISETNTKLVSSNTFNKVNIEKVA